MPASRPELVAIGSSLGGLVAMQLILRELPATFHCPIVLVQHRRAEVDSRLVELLNECAALPVVEPDDKDLIRPGHVYLAPPAYHLVVERGFFSLSLDPPVWFARPSIDVTFESVADSYGPAAVAVMLTGSNEDGAVGARRVKAAGGRVFVEDPTKAKAPEAPAAVLAATAVDAVLALEDVAGCLMGLETPGSSPKKERTSKSRRAS